jgi:hypothetical protein
MPTGLGSLGLANSRIGTTNLTTNGTTSSAGSRLGVLNHSLTAPQRAQLAARAIISGDGPVTEPDFGVPAINTLRIAVVIAASMSGSKGLRRGHSAPSP